MDVSARPRLVEQLPQFVNAKRKIAEINKQIVFLQSQILTARTQRDELLSLARSKVSEQSEDANEKEDDLTRVQKLCRAVIDVATVCKCNGYIRSMIEVAQELGMAQTMEEQSERIERIEEWAKQAPYFTGVDIQFPISLTKNSCFQLATSKKIRLINYLEIFQKHEEVWRDISRRNVVEVLLLVAYELQQDSELISDARLVYSSWDPLFFQKVISGLTRFYCHCVHRAIVTELIVKFEILLKLKQITRDLTSYFDETFAGSLYYCVDSICQMVKEETTRIRANNQYFSPVVALFGPGVTTRSLLLLLQYSQTKLLLNDYENHNKADEYRGICRKLYLMFHLLVACSQKSLQSYLEQTMQRYLTTDEHISIPCIVFNGMFCELEIQMISMKLLGSCSLSFKSYVTLWNEPSYKITDLVLMVCAKHLNSLNTDRVYVHINNLKMICSIFLDAMFAFACFLGQMDTAAENEFSLVFLWFYIAAYSNRFDTEEKEDQMKKTVETMRSFLTRKVPSFSSTIVNFLKTETTYTDLATTLSEIKTNVTLRNRTNELCRSYWEVFLTECDKKLSPKNIQLISDLGSQSHTETDKQTVGDDIGDIVLELESNDDNVPAESSQAIQEEHSF